MKLHQRQAFIEMLRKKTWQTQYGSAVQAPRTIWPAGVQTTNNLLLPHSVPGWALHYGT
jgi:hypothetical protein